MYMSIVQYIVMSLEDFPIVFVRFYLKILSYTFLFILP